MYAIPNKCVAYLSPFSACLPAVSSSQEKVVSSPSTAGSSPRHSLRYKTSEGIVAQLTQNFAARMETLGSPRATGRAGGKARRISEKVNVEEEEKWKEEEEIEAMIEVGKVLEKEKERKEMKEKEEEEEEKGEEKEEIEKEGKEEEKVGKVEEKVEIEKEEDKEEEEVEKEERQEEKEDEVAGEEWKKTVEMEEEEREGEVTVMDLEDTEKLRKGLDQRLEELTVSGAAGGGGGPPFETQTAHSGDNECSWEGKVEEMGEEGEREGEGKRGEETAKQFLPVHDEQVCSEVEKGGVEAGGGEMVVEESATSEPEPIGAGSGNGGGVKGDGVSYPTSPLAVRGGGSDDMVCGGEGATREGVRGDGETPQAIASGSRTSPSVRDGEKGYSQPSALRYVASPSPLFAALLSLPPSPVILSQ